MPLMRGFCGLVGLLDQGDIGRRGSMHLRDDFLDGRHAIEDTA